MGICCRLTIKIMDEKDICRIENEKISYENRKHDAEYIINNLYSHLLSDVNDEINKEKMKLYKMIKDLSN